MASNSLKTFVTNIANEIRKIRGYPDTKKIKPKNFPTELDGFSEDFKRLFYRNAEESPLTEIVIPKYIEKIGDSVLRSSKLLEKVEILGDVTEIRGAAFQHCEKLKTITTTYSQTENVCALPDTVKDIGGYAFNGTAIEHFIAPSDLTKIGVYAFSGCSNCKIFDFSRCKQVPTLVEATAFNGIASDAIIAVPEGKYEEWITATNWGQYNTHITPSFNAELNSHFYIPRLSKTIVGKYYGNFDTAEFPKMYFRSYEGNYTLRIDKEAYAFSEHLVENYRDFPVVRSVGDVDYTYETAQLTTYIGEKEEKNSIKFLSPGAYCLWFEYPNIVGYKWAFIITPVTED